MVGLIGTILSLAENLLALWVSKEKDKYNAKLVELKQAFYAEKNKPEAERDFAVIDNLRFEIQLFADALATQVKLQT